MNILNGLDLCRMLESTEEFEFSNLFFSIENPLNVDIKKITLWNRFENPAPARLHRVVSIEI